MSFPLWLLSRYASNVDTKEEKEGKEWKEFNKEGKEVEPSRPMSVMSSLSYRKRSNIDGKGEALFSSLRENADSEDAFHKGKPKNSDLQHDSMNSRRKSQAEDTLKDRDSVISQAYSEANSRARKGMDSRWGDFDKESVVSYAAPSRASTRLGLSPENDAKSTISLGLSSPLGRHQSTSRLDESRGGRSVYGSSPSSPCFSRRTGGRSPGSVSRADSHMSLARSSRLSEFGVDIDDSRSVAFTERSAYSPHSSTGRSVSMPPSQARSSTVDNDPNDNMDIKTVSHRNYLDPDLEKAINEVLSFKPIKFKRTSLEDSEADEDKSKNDNDDSKSIRNGDVGRPASSLRRSASAVDCTRAPRSGTSYSSRHRSKSKGKSKKKKRSHSSESDSSGDDRRHRSSSRSSSRSKSKKSKKKSKKRAETSSSSSSSSSSDSESDSDSSSGASTISYRSSNSVKRAPVRKTSSPEKAEEEEEEAKPPSGGLNKKDEKKRKKKVDNLMLKYLYRADSD